MADPSRGTKRRETLARSAAVGLALATLGGAGAQLIPSEKPAEIRGMELKNTLGQKLPLDVELQGADGKTVRLGDKFGKRRPVVVAMVYLRCPLLCPQLQQRVIGSFNGLDKLTLGADYDAVFISFDPRDTPLDAARQEEFALSSYDRSKNEQVRQGLSYLVGKAENTQKVADALGFPYRFLPKSGEFSHGTAVYVVTPDGVISHCFTKLEYKPKDLRLALVDASNGQIGTLADRFTLWCYHPTDSGAYVIAPLQVMRIGAGASAVVVFGFVGMWAVRDYRRRRRAQQVGGAGVRGGRGAGPDGQNEAPRGALGHTR